MKVYIPFKPDNPKTRLSPVLDKEEREEFSLAMLTDVYRAVLETDEEPVILSTRRLEPYELEAISGRGKTKNVEIKVSPKPLTPAVNSVLPDSDTEGNKVSIVMSDLALATPESLKRLFESGGDLVVVPGLGAGTNAFVARSPDFEVDYHGTSYLDHLRIAEEANLNVETVDSFRLSTDIDEPVDLVEVLVHNNGKSKEFLKERFELSFDNKKRVGVERKNEG